MFLYPFNYDVEKLSLNLMDNVVFISFNFLSLVDLIFIYF